MTTYIPVDNNYYICCPLTRVIATIPVTINISIVIVIVELLTLIVSQCDHLFSCYVSTCSM